jgi:GNAT superfamily N-acetyltransferase
MVMLVVRTTGSFTAGTATGDRIVAVRVVRASTADVDEVVSILATGFMDDPMSRWIFPDVIDRELRHPVFFRPFVDLAFAHGEIDTTTDRLGAALWFPVDVTADSGLPDLGALFERTLDPLAAQRIADYDERSSANHPIHASHFHLPFIAVRPDHVGNGIGTALLRHRLSRLDQQRTPAYLEASNERSARLYERLGFSRRQPTTDMPDGPSLYPMWREPA